MKRSLTLRAVTCALFAALTAICGQFSVPIGPVPVSLATFSVYLSGAVLGGAGGAVSQAVYVLLGAAGLPVFAGFHGGLPSIFGPTGGYLVGYIICAWITGSMGRRFSRKPLLLAVSMVLGTAALYFLGTAWFLFLTKRTLWESLTLCVFPFLLGDAAKIVITAVVAPRLGKAFEHFCVSAS